jgi:hypothetical protein
MESSTEQPVTAHPVSVDLQFLKDIHNVITVANQRCQWKMSELYPLGRLVKTLEDTIEKGEIEKQNRGKNQIKVPPNLIKKKSDT